MPLNRWDLECEHDDFIRVIYTNLQTGNTMDCGLTDDTFEALVEWMQKSAVGAAVVWMNNEIVGKWP